MWADQALDRFLEASDVQRVLDIGSGAGHHAKRMRDRGKDVTTISLQPPADHLCDYMDFDFPGWMDGIWASHVLEHQPNVGSFLIKCFYELRDEGLLAVTVPPLKNEVVGGHLTLWTPGHLIYNLVLAGFDCSQARVASYGYNISVLVRKKSREYVKLNFDHGDVTLLAKFFPWPITEGFDGTAVGDIRW